MHRSEASMCLSIVDYNDYFLPATSSPMHTWLPDSAPAADALRDGSPAPSFERGVIYGLVGVIGILVIIVVLVIIVFLIWRVKNKSHG